MALSDLDTPDHAIRFSSVEEFLTRLRQFGQPEQKEKGQLGDDRISARSADPGSFWIPDDTRTAVNPDVIQSFTENWGFTSHGLPQAIKSIYAEQNGGAVRFRFAPPQVTNAYGNAVRDPASPAWVDVFPDGLLVMEEWQQFEDWRRQHGLAVEQSLFEFTSRVTQPSDNNSDVKIDLFVIGDHTSSDARMVTLLDMSHDFFNRNRHILTLRYNSETDMFEILFGPMMSDSAYSGLFEILKARKSDL